MLCTLVSYWTEPSRAAVFVGQCLFEHLRPFIELGFGIVS